MTRTELELAGASVLFALSVVSSIRCTPAQHDAASDKAHEILGQAQVYRAALCRLLDRLPVTPEVQHARRVCATAEATSADVERAIRRCVE